MFWFFRLAINSLLLRQFFVQLYEYKTHKIFHNIINFLTTKFMHTKSCNFGFVILWPKESVQQIWKFICAFIYRHIRIFVRVMWINMVDGIKVDVLLLLLLLLLMICLCDCVSVYANVCECMCLEASAKFDNTHIGTAVWITIVLYRKCCDWH